MKPATKQGMSASCGCPHTGSSTVLIEGVGAVRSGRDRATSLIQGGVASVTVEGDPISVQDDPIGSHLKGRHESDPKTANGSRTVLVGNGDAQSGKDVEEGELYASLGGVYEVAVAADPYQPLIDRLNRLRKKYNKRPLSAAEIRIIRSAKGAYFEQLQNTLLYMEEADRQRLTTGRVSGFEYMTKVTRSAAALAEKYGRTAIERGTLFISLMDSSFACHNQLADYWGMEFPRTVLRRGEPNELGMLLEHTGSRILGPDASVGFSKEVIDRKPDNNVHHHFAEFLVVGSINGPLVAQEAQRASDNVKQNPGDVKSGYFASQLGALVVTGRISPSNAARLIDWAYKDNTSAPWSAFTDSPQSLVEKMRQGYNMQHPAGEGIPPFDANDPVWQPPKPPWPFR